ncbi:MAG TPA: permease-like cell division protein FtsX [Abditibacteriaceae bacterium]|jgi:cell division transport system permease protein
MLREFLMFWTRETVSNIGRNRLMSLLAITTATIGLFILGTFFLAISNLQALVKTQTQKIDLVVFLKADVTPKRRKEIFNGARVPQVADLQFVSKDQVLKEWNKSDPDIPMEDFRGRYNPFNDELRIKLKDEYMQDIFKLEDYLGSLQGVVKTTRDRAQERAPVERLLAFRRFLAIAGTVAIIVLGMAILLIIHNAIRLTVFARRREIRIMELVGATSWFIRIPFLLEGILYGVAGAALAAAILSPLYVTLTRIPWPLVQELLPLGAGSLLWNCSALMILAGLCFGFIGSWFSLSRSIGKAASL